MVPSSSHGDYIPKYFFRHNYVIQYHWRVSYARIHVGSEKATFVLCFPADTNRTNSSTTSYGPGLMGAMSLAWPINNVVFTKGTNISQLCGTYRSIQAINIHMNSRLMGA